MSPAQRKGSPQEDLNFPIRHGISREKAKSEQLVVPFDNIRNRISFVLRSLISPILLERRHLPSCVPTLFPFPISSSGRGMGQIPERAERHIRKVKRPESFQKTPESGHSYPVPLRPHPPSPGNDIEQTPGYA